MPPVDYSDLFFEFSKLGRPPVTAQVKPEQVLNNTGGYVFEIDDMERAKRFLILGSDSSFYQPGAKLTLENATVIRNIAQTDRVFDLIDLIVDVSVKARAPKQSPGLFALAVVISQTENLAAKARGYSVLSQVARTASTLFEFVSYLDQFQNLGGMGFQKAIGRWYNEKSLDSLAYQMVKYRQRGGYDHARLLRLSKRVKSSERPELGTLLDWSLGKPVVRGKLHDVANGFELAKSARIEDIPFLIRNYGLSWEMLPTEALNDVKVWEALLAGNVPLGALIRQLPRLTNLGMLAPFGHWSTIIEARLRDRNEIRRARIHPLQALVAMRTYAKGQGKSQSWTPVGRIVDALEEAFYTSFEFVVPTNKTHMLALDVSGSMGWSEIPGLSITPREASACMAMVQARIEPQYLITGFSHHMVQIPITNKTRLADAIRIIENIPMGGTNLSLPMSTAEEQNIPVDAFVIYTDNEVNGGVHPFQALQHYRRAMGIQSKLIVVGMTATRFSVADPSDRGMLDIAGFDTAAPGLIAEFVR